MDSSGILKCNPTSYVSLVRIDSQLPRGVVSLLELSFLLEDRKFISRQFCNRLVFYSLVSEIISVYCLLSEKFIIKLFQSFIYQVISEIVIFIFLYPSLY